MRKNSLIWLTLLAVGFIFGFYTNSLLHQPAPEVLLRLGQNPNILQAGNAMGIEKSNAIRIDFDGIKFSQSVVSVPIGKLIEVHNISESKLMNLVSEVPELNTPRGYGQAERFPIVLMKPGKYTITARDVPSANLEITVEEKK